LGSARGPFTWGRKGFPFLDIVCFFFSCSRDLAVSWLEKKREKKGEGGQPQGA
jgi:hypothetical protein